LKAKEAAPKPEILAYGSSDDRTDFDLDLQAAADGIHADELVVSSNDNNSVASYHRRHSHSQGAHSTSTRF
jgi:hypothetical protein